MLFSSVEFLFLFLPVSLLLCRRARGRLRLGLLTGLSLLFYAWGEPRFLPLLLLALLVNHALSVLLWRHRQRHRAARALLLLAVAINLAPLLVFKYLPLLDALPLPLSLPSALPLPVGISFYTFQAISYLVDVWRGEITPPPSLLAFSAYLTLFPQLIAGPILRYGEVAAALSQPKRSPADTADGIRIFLCGLAKKLLLANRAGLLWERFATLPPDRQTTLGGWLGLWLFLMQLYFDFSGYSDMARGLGRMLGFHFPDNFRYPLCARSVGDFWRRWHVTLTDWFRSYVYIPLGGNRHGARRTLRNLLVVWLLTGLWHGAGLNFVLWGLFFFVALSIERLGVGRWLSRTPRLLQHALTLVVVTFGFFLFVYDGSAAHLSHTAALQMLRTLTGRAAGGFLNVALLGACVRLLPTLTVLLLGATPLPRRLYTALRAHRPAARPLLEVALPVALLLVCTAYLVDGSYNPFLYFRF